MPSDPEAPKTSLVDVRAALTRAAAEPTWSIHRTFTQVESAFTDRRLLAIRVAELENELRIAASQTADAQFKREREYREEHYEKDPDYPGAVRWKG